jgi:hypothetical protein
MFLAFLVPLALGNRQALAQQQVTIHITSPTNNPQWTTGNGGSVWWTFSSGYSGTRVRIYDTDRPTDEFLNQSYGAPLSSPTFANFTVPRAYPGQVAQCTLIVEAIGTMGTVVGSDTTSVKIYTP